MRTVLKTIVSTALLAGTAGTCFALTPLNPNTNYTITSSKLNSDGTVTNIETNVPAATDANGKLTFSLNTVPTNADANFLAFTIKDGTGAVVRQGVVPAPPSNDVNQIGINDLATAQAAAFLKAAQLAGSDDPILAGYLMVLLRSPNVLPTDVTKLGNLGKAAILNGFETYLGGKVPAAKVTALKSCLIYNPDSTKKTLRDITKGFYAAVESADAATESSETQKAGALMADVFMDAAACADIPLDLITNSHDAAGDAAQTTGLMDTTSTDPISSDLISAIDQSMSTFNRKIGMVKMVAKYTNALNTLQGSGTQVNTFITAAQTMAQSSQAVDTTYSEFFKNPTAYCTANSTDQATVQNAINTIYQNAWTAFQSSIASSDADITALKSQVQAVLPGIQLPPDFGLTFINGSQLNWPVQQVVMVKWMLNLIQNGGNLSYTRDTLPIPTNMQMWVGTCSNTMYWDQMGCQSHGGTWTAQRSNFNTPSAAFNAYLAIQQDVQIADMTRSSIWDNGNQPTQSEKMTAAENFLTNLAHIAGNIVATKGGVSATDDEKNAVITLMLQPQND